VLLLELVPSLDFGIREELALSEHEMQKSKDGYDHLHFGTGFKGIARAGLPVGITTTL